MEAKVMMSQDSFLDSVSLPIGSHDEFSQLIDAQVERLRALMTGVRARIGEARTNRSLSPSGVAGAVSKIIASARADLQKLNGQAALGQKLGEAKAELPSIPSPATDPLGITNAVEIRAELKKLDVLTRTFFLKDAAANGHTEIIRAATHDPMGNMLEQNLMLEIQDQYLKSPANKSLIKFQRVEEIENVIQIFQSNLKQCEMDLGTIVGPQ